VGKLGFFLSVIMIGAVVTSLIVNIHLFTVINRLNDEVFFLKLSPKDRAVEISRKTTGVQDALNYAAGHGYNRSGFEPYVDYWNADYIESYIQIYPTHNLSYPNWYDKLSEGYGIWRIFWDIWPNVSIIHFIDENTGEILHEEIHHLG